jgi:hypothetical protein
MGCYWCYLQEATDAYQFSDVATFFCSCASFPREPTDFEKRSLAQLMLAAQGLRSWGLSQLSLGVIELAFGSHWRCCAVVRRHGDDRSTQITDLQE